ncbi:hypothetical protein NL676_038046 [Syzygium grande]|nr:hypothetical protein NL676_038046 [Syzygium grande]
MSENGVWAKKRIHISFPLARVTSATELSANRQQQNLTRKIFLGTAKSGKNGRWRGIGWVGGVEVDKAEEVAAAGFCKD